MPYNPNLHHRRSIRLKGYDYSQAGLYFITICCQNRICRFGKIENGKMILNEYGQIAQQCWLEIPEHFPDAILHEFVIMPNHIHGIIEITGNVGAKNILPPQTTNVQNVGAKNLSPEYNNYANNVGAKNFSPLQTPQRPNGTSRTIGSIVRGFKIGVTKQFDETIWQRNFYEHIIRNEQSYQNISDYIIHNPENWTEDKFYIE
jgi:REP element-mobilizing transposase RayT